MAHGQGEVLNLGRKLETFVEHWSPRVAAEFNDHQLKLAKLQGEFVWHSHPDVDEVFLVLAGKLRIEFRDRTAFLAAGELFVVPRGVEHRPSAVRECHVALIEPRGTMNTGDAGGERTVKGDLRV